MNKQHAGLLEQIERDVVDSRAALADLLRKCIVLGGKSGSARLRDWAGLELNGYVGEDTLPEYRVIAALLQLDGFVGHGQIKGQTISPSFLPAVAHDLIKEEVELRSGVGELESIARRAADGGVKLGIPGGADLVRIMNHESQTPFQYIERIYWTVSESVVIGVLDRIRTKLAELVAEMRATTPSGDHLPSATAADQAVQVVIHGDQRGVMTLNTSQASAGATAAVESVVPNVNGGWTRWRKFGAAMVGTATVSGAVVAVAQWQGWSPF